MTGWEEAESSGGLLGDLEALVHRVVDSGAPPDEYSLQDKLNLLERVVELLRLRTGDVENEVSVDGMMKRFESADPALRTLRFGPKEPRLGRPNAILWFHPYALQLPLMLHLVGNWERKQRIHDLVRDFVKGMREHLNPGDVERTKTGVTRIVTNTRFAARAFRLSALLQVSDDVAYKAWELTHLGLLVGARLAADARSGQVQVLGYPRIVASQTWLHEELARIVSSWRDPSILSRDVWRIAAPNQDVLGALRHLVGLATRYYFAVRDQQAASPEERRNREKIAVALLWEIQETISVVKLADAFAVDSALHDLTEEGT